MIPFATKPSMRISPKKLLIALLQPDNSKGCHKEIIMAVESSRSKFHFYNSMLCLLKALEGKRVTVEIRSEKKIYGILNSVERDMNLNMSDVIYSDVNGKHIKFSQFYIRGRQIRFVIIPDEVDIIEAMKWQLNKGEYYREKERKERQRHFRQKQDRRTRGRGRAKAGNK
ncbi:U7 snRNA-associated Sm-like protein LSm10 [Bulinus truncatus]|nr:U7 snRNA-associated Sm-like protein LSm10 [Bulinus truncatus]